MRKTQNQMDSKMQQAHDWLQDPQALHGGVGEKSVRQVDLHDKICEIVISMKCYILFLVKTYEFYSTIVQQILEQAQKVADRSLPIDAEHLRKVLFSKFKIDGIKNCPVDLFFKNFLSHSNSYN